MVGGYLGPMEVPNLAELSNQVAIYCLEPSLGWCPICVEVCFDTGAKNVFIACPSRGSSLLPTRDIG